MGNPSTSLYKKQLVQVYSLALDLFDDSVDAAHWMHTENSYFFNHSPYDYVLLGHGTAVIELLEGKTR